MIVLIALLCNPRVFYSIVGFAFCVVFLLGVPPGWAGFYSFASFSVGFMMFFGSFGHFFRVLPEIDRAELSAKLAQDGVTLRVMTMPSFLMLQLTKLVCLMWMALAGFGFQAGIGLVGCLLAFFVPLEDM